MNIINKGSIRNDREKRIVKEKDNVRETSIENHKN